MILAFDTETALIGPAQVAPALVCLSWAEPADCGLYHQSEPELDEYVDALLQEGVPVVGQNVAYDFGVLAQRRPELLPRIFGKYARDEVYDTSIRQKLLDIADGCYRGRRLPDGTWEELKYSLEDLAMRWLSRKLDKDTWRLRYAELMDVPLAFWPQGAKDYPIDDARSTRDVHLAQEPRAADLVDQHRQARAAWGLHLCAAWGIRTNAAAVAAYEARVRNDLDRDRDALLASGLLMKKKEGGFKREVKLAQMRMIEVTGGDYKRTETGKPSLDEDACMMSGDALLMAFQRFGASSTALDRVAELRAGVELPIHTRFEVLLETGRTSSSAPNIQSRPRKEGDRECFVPRAGCVFIGADYDGVELRSNAQVCIFAVGFSRLAEVLNAGADPHVMLGAQLREMNEADFARLLKEEKEAGADGEHPDSIQFARYLAKKGNFGFFAGASAKTLVQRVAEEGVRVPLELMERCRRAWYETWPEMGEYHRWIQALCGGAGLASVVQFLSERRRGMVSYTEAANGFSQGLAADGAKAALFAIQRACYAEPESPLYGCRLVNFIHDEFLLEAPEERAHEAAMELAHVMCHEFNTFVPDVPTTTTPALMRKWSKKAHAVYSEGRLIPWEDAK